MSDNQPVYTAATGPIESSDVEPPGKPHWLVWAAGGVLLVLAAMVAGVALGGGRTGTQAPAFAGTTAQGETINLEDFRGKVVVLDFWATWCPPCVASMPKMKAFHAAYHEKGVEVIGISGDMDRQALNNFEVQNALPFPTIFDGADSIIRQYGVRAFPTLVVIDRQGKIRQMGHHINLEAAVRPLL